MTCTYDVAEATAAELFTANAMPDVGECDDPLGTLGTTTTPPRCHPGPVIGTVSF